MFRILAAVVVMGLGLASPAQATQCKMRLTFINNHTEGKIRVKFLFGPHYDANVGGREQIGNLTINRGASASTRRMQNLANGKVGQGALFHGPGDTRSIGVWYQLWVPGERRWVLKNAYFDNITCTHNSTLTLRLPSANTI